MLIHYNEKWFWGLLIRRQSKAYEELGLEQTSFKAYHRNYINKIMGIVFTAYVFTENIMNIGHAYKLRLFRSQSYRVTKKKVRELV